MWVKLHRFMHWQAHHTPPGYAATNNPLEQYHRKVKLECPDGPSIPSELIQTLNGARLALFSSDPAFSSVPTASELDLYRVEQRPLRLAASEKKLAARSFGSFVEFLADYTIDDDSNSDNVKDLALGIRQVVFAVARQQCANTQDRYYVRLTGHGGSGGSTSGDETKPGEHEAVLVLPVRWSGERLAEHSFFYTGSVHNYRVPIDQFGPHLAHRIVALDVYAWGAGRAGERSSNGASSDLRNGVFARGVLRARAGDFVDILVGGGGLQNVRGGFNGGGNGGTGDFPAVVRLTCAWMDEQPS
ncbi:hypothetical protein GN958_ATG16552 [Phytophthora infestans]|uniref:Uncharacterized protein n=1 Tax=Phytophthora infestans TaxID=4787 RepID=A0A8S9U3N1_PHYIN|nr:hypothetical protein GN958_ATG16552 [Phytophthora infestans]